MKKKSQNYQIFLPLAQKLKVLFPTLNREIIQAKLKDDPVVLLAKAIYSALIRSIIISLPLIVTGILISIKLLWFGLAAFPLVLLFSFFTGAKTPQRKAIKRVRLLERDLPYALRHILIEVKSGIPLFQAMVSVSEGYGESSREFEQIVKEIHSGIPEVQALENAIFRNPSLEFRRSLWQIINSLESGANVSSTLESLVDSIVNNQVLSVQKYGKELNPYTLIYMLAAVILPSLGVTFLMILSTFTGIKTSDTLFYGILVFLILFQYFFINFIRSKRPLIKV